MALSLAILPYAPKAHAEILYVSFDSSTSTHAYNPYYYYAGTFTPTHDGYFGASNNAWLAITIGPGAPGTNMAVVLSTTTPTGNYMPYASVNAFVTINNLDPNQATTTRWQTQISGCDLGIGLCYMRTSEPVYIYITTNQGVGFAAPPEFLSDSSQNLYGEITDNDIPYFVVPTKIIAVTPPSGTTIATSTTATVGAKVSINSKELIDALVANNGNWFVQMTITPSSVVTGIPTAAGSFDAAFGTKIFKFPITTSGTINFSTTTAFTSFGSYNVTTQIIRPSPYNDFLTWWGFGSATVLDATTTSFTVSTSTAFQQTVQNAIQNIVNHVTADVPNSCKDLSLSQWISNMGDCINLIFIPSSDDMSRVMADLNAGVFAYAPFGYVTRVVNILNGQATSTFPMISASIPNPSNPSTMMTYTFDQNEAFAGAADVLENLTIPQDPSINARAAMDLIVKTIIALSVISYIFYDLAHSRKASGHRIRTKLS